MKLSFFLPLFYQFFMMEYSYCKDLGIQSILEKALNLQKESKWDSAQVYFTQLVPMLEEKNDFTELANVYRSMGNGFIRQAQFDSALTYIEKSIYIAEQFLENPNLVLMKGYNSLAVIWGQQGQFLKAGENFKLALQYHLSSKNDNLQLTAKLYNNIGVAFERISQYDSAIVNFKKALAIKTDIYGSKDQSLGKTFNNMGILNHSRANFSEAIHYFTKALETENIESDPHHLSNIYHNLGMVYADLGELDMAGIYFQKAIHIISKEINPDHENIAVNSTALGRLEEKRGNYSKALEYYQKAVHIFTEFNPDLKFYLATTYNNMGYAYELMDNYIQALVYYIKALAIYNSLDKAYSASSLTLSNIGRMYRLTEDFQNALVYGKQALGLRIELFGEIHPLVASSYKEIGDVYLSQRELERALQNFQKACEALSETFISDSYLAFPKAEEVTDKLIYLSVLQSKVSTIIAKAANMRDSENKIKYYSACVVGSETAVDLIGHIRKNYLFLESKFVLSEVSKDIYALGIQAAVNLYNITKNESFIRLAYQYSELSRSGILWEALQASDARQFQGVPKEVTDREDELKRELAYLQNELDKEEENNEKNQDKLKQLRYMQFPLITEYEQLMNTIKRNYPDFYQIKFPERNINFDKIKNSMENNEMLIEYFLGERDIYIFSLLNMELNLSTISKPENFADMVVELNRSIKKMKMEKMIRISGQLYDLLIHPLKKKMKKVKKLKIIPTGVLNNLPFEVLIKEKYKGNYDKIAYLIQDYEISYNFSGDFLYKSGETKIKKGRNFIGFAPVNHFSSYYEGDNELSALDGTEDELNSISTLYSNHKLDASVYLKHSATESQFKQMPFADYEILHIATHGILNHEHPELSALVFYNDDSTSEDGLLYSSEVYNLNLGSDLVVLSSCESGIGKLVTGEGMLSLARGFMYAGTDNILYTLWRVGDKASSEMMGQFYRFILSGNDYASALRQAKLEMLKNDETAPPRNWSGFVLVGG